MRRDTYLTFYVKMEIQTTTTTFNINIKLQKQKKKTLKEAVGHEISTVINLLNVFFLFLLLFQVFHMNFSKRSKNKYHTIHLCFFLLQFFNKNLIWPEKHLFI